MGAVRTSGKRITLTTRPVTGLGDQAVTQVLTELRTAGRSPPQVGLVLRSGNTVITLSYGVFVFGPARAEPTVTSMVAGTIVMARDVLTALGRPAAVRAPATFPLPAGPRYASPGDLCTAVRSSTVARYAPGASAMRPVGSSGVPGTAQTSYCGWDTMTTSLTVSLSVFPDPRGAQQECALDVQAARQSGNGTTFTGAQPVSGAGQQATAVFQTRPRGARAVTLYVRSGNAEAQATFADQPGAAQPRAVKLAAVTAVARDVLAAALPA